MGSQPRATLFKWFDGLHLLPPTISPPSSPVPKSCLCLGVFPKPVTVHVCCLTQPVAFFHIENQTTGLLINIAMGEHVKNCSNLPSFICTSGAQVSEKCAHSHCIRIFCFWVCCSVHQNCPVSPTHLLGGRQKLLMEADCRNSGHLHR